MFGTKRTRDFTVQGNIEDGNIVIVTDDGKEHICDRPNRVGLNYETPWLPDGRPGSRMWNIDPLEIMRKYVNGQDYTQGAYFVIGKWGTGYDDSSPDTVDTIRLQDIVAFRQLVSKVACEPGCDAKPGHIGHCWIKPSKLATDLGMTKDQAITMFKQWFESLSAGDVINLGYKLGLTDDNLKTMIHAFTGR